MTRPVRIEDDPSTHGRATCICPCCIDFREQVRSELYSVRLKYMEGIEGEHTNAKFTLRNMPR